MYATQTDIAERIAPIHLTELADDNCDGEPDAGIIEAVIEDADAVVDSFLVGRYDPPLSPTPPLVRKLSTDLAVANLFARSRESESPLHSKRALEARVLLEALGRGDIALPDASDYGFRPAADSTTRSREPVFDEEVLEPY